MRNDIDRILISEEEIQQRVKEMGSQLAKDYAGKDPLMVCILKGSVMFFADLLRAMEIPLTIDFMAASSYGNATESSGELKIKKDLSEDIRGRHVVIVEDIVDSGFTLSSLIRLLSSRGAASIALATLLDKPSGRREGISLKADYCGFEIENVFVVGYGLDYAEKYRNLPYVGVLKPEVYEKH